MKQNRINEDEVGAMLEEAFEGEPFERIEPPPRFSLFYRGAVEPESFLDKLKRFLTIPSVPRRLVFSGAVVAILLMVLIPLMPGDGQLTYRDAGPAISSDLPEGRLDTAPTVLHWPAEQGVASYRVELFNPDGDRLWEGATVTNSIDFPDHLFSGHPAGIEYRIYVTEYSPDGTVTGDRSSRFMVLP